MKTKRLFMAAFVAIAMGFSASASTSSYVTNDTQNEKGQTVERTVCESFNNILTPFRKIEFKYNDNGQLIEKNTMKWDSMDNEWTNFELTKYDYSQSPMKVVVLKWNERKKEYK